jgi:hypothetical protein
VACASVVSVFPDDFTTETQRVTEFCTEQCFYQGKDSFQLNLHR